jgi:hypothetical protein
MNPKKQTEVRNLPIRAFCNMSYIKICQDVYIIYIVLVNFDAEEFRPRRSRINFVILMMDRIGLELLKQKIDKIKEELSSKTETEWQLISSWGVWAEFPSFP